MKRFIAFIFLLAFTMQTFSRAVVVAWFYANQQEIAQTLCENRDKPKMNCCGKCQLHKAIAKEDKQQDDKPFLKFENKAEVLFCDALDYIISPLTSSDQTYFARINSAVLPSRSCEILKPPC